MKFTKLLCHENWSYTIHGLQLLSHSQQPNNNQLYRVATLVKHKSWKAMMDTGWDSREGIFFIFMADCQLVIDCNSIMTNLAIYSS